MFLKKRKINGTYYWSLAENYREEHKIKQKIIKNLGNTEKAKKILVENKEYTKFLVELNATIEFKVNSILNIECIKGMKLIPDKSIDMIFSDLPYGTTQNPWDSIIPFNQLWKQYERIIKDNGVILLFAQAPFDKILGASNKKLLRYEWIWEKNKATGHLNAKIAPMKAHENILVFYKKLPIYNPQKSKGHKPVHSYTKHQTDGSNYGTTKIGISGGGSTERNPRSVLKFNAVINPIHSTQKPIDLCEYLIKTYTNEGDIVLDNCCGSGSIPLAAALNNRKFIGMDNGICDREKSEFYNMYWADIAKERLLEASKQMQLSI